MSNNLSFLLLELFNSTNSHDNTTSKQHQRIIVGSNGLDTFTWQPFTANNNRVSVRVRNELPRQIFIQCNKHFHLNERLLMRLFRPTRTYACCQCDIFLQRGDAIAFHYTAKKTSRPIGLTPLVTCSEMLLLHTTTTWWRCI